MAVEIQCGHAFAPNQTEASMAILMRFIGPLPMRRLPDGSLYCSCGYTIKSTRKEEL